MPCAIEPTKDGNGIAGFWCGPGIDACDFCGVIAVRLCDFPMGGGTTCDAHLCYRCRVQQGGAIRDIDFCPPHALIALGMVTGPPSDQAAS